MALKLTPTFGNEKEYYYQMGKESQLFNQSDFDQIEDKDAYMQIMSSTLGKESSTFDQNKYDTFYDPDLKLSYIMDSFYGDQNDADYQARMKAYDEQYTIDLRKREYDKMNAFEKIYSNIKYGETYGTLKGLGNLIDGIYNLGKNTVGWFAGEVAYIKALSSNGSTEQSSSMTDKISNNMSSQSNYVDPEEARINARNNIVNSSDGLIDLIFGQTTDELLQPIADRYTAIGKNKGFWSDAVEFYSGAIENLTRELPMFILNPYGKIGATIGQGIYFGSMLGNTAQEAVENNPNISNANLLMYTAAVGATEYATEKVFGDYVFGKGLFDPAQAALGIKNQFAKSLAYFGIKGLSEASEEMAAEIIENGLYNKFVGQKDLSIKEVLYAGLMGGLLGVIGDAVGVANTKSVNGLSKLDTYVNTLEMNNNLSELSDALSKKSEVAKFKYKHQDVDINNLPDNLKIEYNTAANVDYNNSVNIAKYQYLVAYYGNILGVEGVAKANDLLNYTVEQQASQARLNSIYGSDARIKNNARVQLYNKYNKDGSKFIPVDDITAEEAQIARGLKAIFPEKTFVFGNVTGRPNWEWEGATTHENTVFINRDVATNKSAKYFINNLISHEIVHTFQRIGGVLNEKSMDLLDKIMKETYGIEIDYDSVQFGKDFAYKNDALMTRAEKQAILYTQQLLYNKNFIKEVYNYSPKLIKQTYQFLKKYSKNLSYKNPKSKNILREVNAIMTSYRQAIAQRITNETDATAICKELDFTEAQTENFMASYLQPNQLDDHILFSAVDLSPQSKMYIQVKHDLFDNFKETVSHEKANIGEVSSYKKSFLDSIGYTPGKNFIDTLNNYLSDKNLLFCKPLNQLITKSNFKEHYKTYSDGSNFVNSLTETVEKMLKALAAADEFVAYMEKTSHEQDLTSDKQSAQYYRLERQKNEAAKRFNEASFDAFLTYKILCVHHRYMTDIYDVAKMKELSHSKASFVDINLVGENPITYKEFRTKFFTYLQDSYSDTYGYSEETRITTNVVENIFRCFSTYSLRNTRNAIDDIVQTIVDTVEHECTHAIAFIDGLYNGASDDDFRDLFEQAHLTLDEEKYIITRMKIINPKVRTMSDVCYLLYLASKGEINAKIHDTKMWGTFGSEYSFYIDTNDMHNLKFSESLKWLERFLKPKSSSNNELEVKSNRRAQKVVNENFTPDQKYDLSDSLKQEIGLAIRYTNKNLTSQQRGELLQAKLDVDSNVDNINALKTQIKNAQEIGDFDKTAKLTSELESEISKLNENKKTINRLMTVSRGSQKLETPTKKTTELYDNFRKTRVTKIANLLNEYSKRYRLKTKEDFINFGFTPDFINALTVDNKSDLSMADFRDMIRSNNVVQEDSPNRRNINSYLVNNVLSENMKTEFENLYYDSLTYKESSKLGKQIAKESGKSLKEINQELINLAKKKTNRNEAILEGMKIAKEKQLATAEKITGISKEVSLQNTTGKDESMTLEDVLAEEMSSIDKEAVIKARDYEELSESSENLTKTLIGLAKKQDVKLGVLLKQIYNDLRLYKDLISQKTLDRYVKCINIIYEKKNTGIVKERIINDKGDLSGQIIDQINTKINSLEKQGKNVDSYRQRLEEVKNDTEGLIELFNKLSEKTSKNDVTKTTQETVKEEMTLPDYYKKFINKDGTFRLEIYTKDNVREENNLTETQVNEMTKDLIQYADLTDEQKKLAKKNVSRETKIVQESGEKSQETKQEDVEKSTQETSLKQKTLDSLNKEDTKNKIKQVEEKTPTKQEDVGEQKTQKITENIPQEKTFEVTQDGDSYTITTSDGKVTKDLSLQDVLAETHKLQQDGYISVATPKKKIEKTKTKKYSPEQVKETSRLISKLEQLLTKTKKSEYQGDLYSDDPDYYYAVSKEALKTVSTELNKITPDEFETMMTQLSVVDYNNFNYDTAAKRSALKNALLDWAYDHRHTQFKSIADKITRMRKIMTTDAAQQQGLVSATWGGPHAVESFASEITIQTGEKVTFDEEFLKTNLTGGKTISEFTEAVGKEIEKLDEQIKNEKDPFEKSRLRDEKNHYELLYNQLLDENYEGAMDNVLVHKSQQETNVSQNIAEIQQTYANIVDYIVQNYDVSNKKVSPQPTAKKRIISPENKEKIYHTLKSIESFRYLMMLASPVTGFRNTTSNTLISVQEIVNDSLSKTLEKKVKTDSKTQIRYYGDYNSDFAEYIDETYGTKVKDELQGSKYSQSQKDRLKAETAKKLDPFEKSKIKKYENKLLSDTPWTYRRAMRNLKNTIAGARSQILDAINHKLKLLYNVKAGQAIGTIVKQTNRELGDLYVDAISDSETSLTSLVKLANKLNLDIMQQIYNDALYRADYLLFKTENWASKAIKQLETKSPAAAMLLRTIIPFIRVNVNTSNYILDHSPVGIIKGIVKLIQTKNMIFDDKRNGIVAYHKQEFVKQTKKEGEPYKFEEDKFDAWRKNHLSEEINKAIDGDKDAVNKVGDEMAAAGKIHPGERDIFSRAKAIESLTQGLTGTAAMIVGVLLAALTGAIGYDDDDQYIGPYLKIGDIKIILDDLSPFNTLFVAGAMLGSGNVDDKFETFCSVLIEQSFFNIFESALTYSNSVLDFVENQTINYIQSFIPAPLKNITKMFNRKNDKTGDFFIKLLKTTASNLPGFNYLVESKINPYTGESERIYESGFIEALLNQVSPIGFRIEQYSELEKEAIRVGAETTGTGSTVTINDISYSVKGNAQYAKDRATYVAKELTKLFKSSKYSKMTDKEKASAIKSVYRYGTESAKINYWTSMNKYRVFTTNEEYLRYKDYLTSPSYTKKRYNGYTGSKYVG